MTGRGAIWEVRWREGAGLGGDKLECLPKLNDAVGSEEVVVVVVAVVVVAMVVVVVEDKVEGVVVLVVVVVVGEEGGWVVVGSGPGLPDALLLFSDSAGAAES